MRNYKKAGCYAEGGVVAPFRGRNDYRKDPDNDRSKEPDNDADDRPSYFERFMSNVAGAVQPQRDRYPKPYRGPIATIGIRG